jgi:hypothetical protein
MSRVIEFSEAGGPEVLRFKNVDVPKQDPAKCAFGLRPLD